MSSSQETGYKADLGNFEEIIEYCTSLGTGYNPSLARIQISAMSTQHTNATKIQSDYEKILNNWGLAVADNEVNFKPSKKKATRVLAASKSSGMPKENIVLIKSLCDYIRGYRHTPLPKAGTPEADKIISTSHQGMDNQMSFWEQLIDLLSKIPQYQPDAADITVTGLTTWRNKCVASLDLDKKRFSEVVIKRGKRNEAFTLEPMGLVPLSLEAKEYVKGKFGARSFEYKHITKIHLRKNHS